MALLGHRLRRHGMGASLFGYVAAVERFDRIVRRLRQRLTAEANAGEYVVVGHSLGGLLLRAAIAELPPAVRPPRHLFMVATPNQSPRLARRFHRNPLFRLLTGDAGQLLADVGRVGAIPIPRLPTTIIAGVSGWRETGSWFRQEANDWIVALSEVRLADVDDLVTLNAGHTFVMNHREVVQVILGRVGRRAEGPGNRE